MEFCEKSTLRQLIDEGLHEDMERVWRLFREVIEGLSHIHKQVRLCSWVTCESNDVCISLCRRVIVIRTFRIVIIIILLPITRKHFL